MHIFHVTGKSCEIKTADDFFNKNVTVYNLLSVTTALWQNCLASPNYVAPTLTVFTL